MTSEGLCRLCDGYVMGRGRLEVTVSVVSSSVVAPDLLCQLVHFAPFPRDTFSVWFPSLISL